MKNIFAFVKNQNVLKWILGVYFLNGCLACLCKNTPLLNIFLTATTAAIGAGLPVWLVWHLTEQSRELKEKEKFKDSMMLEYSIALSNLSKTCGSYMNLEYIIHNNVSGNVLIAQYDEHNLHNLVSVANFFSSQNDQNMKNGIVSLALIASQEIQVLKDMHDTIEKRQEGKLYYNQAEIIQLIEQLKKCQNLLNQILINHGRILCCIADYIRAHYQIDLFEELKDLTMYKMFEKQYTVQQEQEKRREQSTNVSTEKLSK